MPFKYMAFACLILSSGALAMLLHLDSSVLYTIKAPSKCQGLERGEKNVNGTPDNSKSAARFNGSCSLPAGETFQIPPPSCNTWQEYMKRRITIAGDGFEPSTFGLWARRAARLLYPALLPWRLTRAISERHIMYQPRCGPIDRWL